MNMRVCARLGGEYHDEKEPNVDKKAIRTRTWLSSRSVWGCRLGVTPFRFS